MIQIQFGKAVKPGVEQHRQLRSLIFDKIAAYKLVQLRHGFVKGAALLYDNFRQFPGLAGGELVG